MFKAPKALKKKQLLISTPFISGIRYFYFQVLESVYLKLFFPECHRNILQSTLYTSIFCLRKLFQLYCTIYLTFCWLNFCWGIHLKKKLILKYIFTRSIHRNKLKTDYKKSAQILNIIIKNLNFDFKNISALPE